MRETVVRGISGLLFVSLLIFTIFASQFWFTVLFFAIGAMCLIELKKLIKLDSWLPFLAFPVLFYYIIWYERNDTIENVLLGATLMVNIFLISDLLSLNKIPLYNTKKYIIALLYMMGSMIFLTLIPLVQDHYDKWLVASVFALVWVNDSFAYLVGKNFGKTKLLERISPKKTIEGSMGGLVFTVITAGIIGYYSETYSITTWMILGAIVVIFGTLGDLIQSKFKRQAQVKDSGKIMPGHGGLFDRMDSVLFSAPFVYGFLLILNYVSQGG